MTRLDYVREVVNDREIDVPYARRSLIQSAVAELRKTAERRPVAALLYGAYITLQSSPDAEQLRRAVDDLCRVMDDRFGDVHDMGLPDDHEHPAMDPDPEASLGTAAQHFGDIAAILRALELLSWVLAYDEIQPPVFGEDDDDDA